MGGAGANFADSETPSGTVNGTNTDFTLINAPSPAGSLIVALNETIQIGGGVNYTLTGVTISFVTAPMSGSIIRAWYRY